MTPVVYYMDDFVFAEIDIEPVGGNGDIPRPASGGELYAAVNHSAHVHTPCPEPIIPRTPDPVREKFFEMRTLASQKPFPKNDSELFYRQALFMENFTDNYENEAPFNMYYPCYQRMGYDYLRTYFTWRTRYRSGEVVNTSTSYIFLYIYELLCGIGTDNPQHGLECLTGIWKNFSKTHIAVEKNMPRWFKDYHVYYQLENTFTQFVSDNNLQNYYPLTLLSDTQSPGQLERFNKLSNYNITKSRFYKDGNEELLCNCFDAVIKAIKAFCEVKHTRFEELLIYSVSRRMPWQPFENALFVSKTPAIERRAEISEFERYFCTNGNWSANLPIYYSSQKEFIGYIIKKTEACLRAVTGYKYKLAVEMKPGTTSFRELKKPAAKRAELDSVIDKAVREFYDEINRVVVTVDHESLSRIRELAMETQEQLIVEEYSEPQPLPDAADDSNIPQTLSFADGWSALGEMLTDPEKQALALVLGESGNLKSLADEHGVMLEVLIDGINEKASDCIGDSIMELADVQADAAAQIYVFDEYKTYLQKLVHN